MTLVSITYKMELKRLNSDVITKTRSSFTLNTVCQCILELVLNSMDAKATAIAIRVNLVTFRIQVVDNGEGIVSENMELIGFRYFTNKCNNLEELENHIKYYGFRGEALANLTELSKIVTIISRGESSSKTYKKTLVKNSKCEVSLDKTRPSVGTTVTVEGLFDNFPVRKKRIVKELELDDIKKNIKSLIIIHPGVTFSVRDDVSGELILTGRKSEDIPTAFKSLYPDTKEGTVMKISKGKISINALLFKSYWENNKLQYIYVNKRPIYSSKIQKLISKMFNKNIKRNNVENKKIYPLYVLNIKCPYSDVDILLNPSKTMAEFKNWDRVEHCIEKLLNCYFGTNQEKIKTIEKVSENKLNCGVSQINGVVQAYGYKRKNIETQKPQEKLRKCGGTVVSKKSILKKLTTEQNVAVNEKHDETYDIIEPSFCNEEIQRFKQPLPITIVPKEKELYKRSLNHEVNNKKILELTDKTKIEEDTLSKFTNDEDKGKNLILDMFLKSTQIYKSDENIYNSTQGSGETIYEEESNILMQNNIQTKYNGRSKTMSMSINLKSTKKIKRHKKLLSEKCIQTSLHNNMTSKGLQTTLKEDKSANYTLVFDNNAKFVFKKGESSKNFEFAYTQGCSCSCHGNYFNFGQDEILNKGKRDFDHTHFENHCKKNFEEREYNYKAGIKPNDAENIFDLNKKDTRINPYKHLTNKNYLHDLGKNVTNFFSKNIQYTSNTNPCKHLTTNRKNIPRDFGKNENIPTNCTPNLTVLKNSLVQMNPGMDFNQHALGNQWNINKKIKLDNNLIYEQSPYFKPKNKTEYCKKNYFNPYHSPLENTQCNFNLFKIQNEDKFCDMNPRTFGQLKPIYKSPQTNLHLDVNSENNVNFLFGKYENNQETFQHKIYDNWEMTIRSFEQFRPVHKSTQQNPYLEKIVENHNTDLTLRSAFNFPKKLDVQKYCKTNYFNPYNSTNTQCNFDLFKIQNEDTFCDMNPRTFGQFKPIYKSPQKNLHLDVNPENNVNWETTIRSFEQFRPVHKSTQQNPYLEKTVENHNTNLVSFSDFNFPKKLGVQKCFEAENFQSAKHLHFQKPQERTVEATSASSANDISKINIENQNEGPNKNVSDLVVTLSESEKRNLLERELGAEKSLLMKEFLEWDSQFTHEENENLKEEWDWTKREHFGRSYYVNKKTGYSTYNIPKQKNLFKLGERHAFLPKGMSPILKEIKKVDKSLSQNGKDTLFEYILETYKDDLIFVKWQHYLKDLDGKTFFENMYKEKLKMYETGIPNICTVEKNQDIINLNKDIFENLEIIGQLDKKFIVVKELNENMLTIFDQHAIHERIRLENLMKIYKNAKSACKEKLMFFIPQNELSVLKRHESYLDYIGMTLEFFSNGVYVTEIPLCLHFKFNKEDSTTSLNKMILILIKEIIELLKSTRDVSLKILPTLIQNVINLEACRGAIKFGDPLTHKQCSELLRKLSATDLPFQCAHGRPTVTPLLRLSSEPIEHTVNILNLKALKKMVI